MSRQKIKPKTIKIYMIQKNEDGSFSVPNELPMLPQKLRLSEDFRKFGLTKVTLEYGDIHHIYYKREIDE